MVWFKRTRESNGQSSSGEQERLRFELLNRGVGVDIPELVRSLSSQSSLGSCGDLSFDGDSPKEQQITEQLARASLKSHFESERTAEKGASFLEVLGGIHYAVEAQNKVAAEKLSKDESESAEKTKDVPQSIAAAPRPVLQRRLTEPCQQEETPKRSLARRRTICPAATAKSASNSSPAKIKPQDMPWRGGAMHTFPKASIRTPKFGGPVDPVNLAPNSTENSLDSRRKSISFSQDVHVLEYEPDLVQYSSPEWSQYFS